VESLFGEELWARLATFADVFQPCAAAMRVMQRSGTRLPDTVTIYRRLNEEIRPLLFLARDRGYVTAEQVQQAINVLEARLKEAPLLLTAWALMPKNTASITPPQRKVVSAWLSERATLYGTLPAKLTTEFDLYVTKDWESNFAERADVWKHADQPARFWRMVRFEDPECSLSHVGEQLVQFLAHAGARVVEQ
jgi:hypothetical protein